jgi:TolB protein
VFARAGLAGADIFVLELATGAVRQLTSAAGDDVEPAWSPDGRRIAFASTRDGDLEIYVMNADGSAQANASNSHRASDRSPAWEPVQAQYASVIRRRTRVFNPQARPCTKSGNDRANAIRGTRGPDILCGRGGSDRIDGLAGADTLRGEDGNDVIRARDGEPDKIFGGEGRDIAFVDLTDDVDGVEEVR